MKNNAIITGHDVLAVERFMDDTRHMVIYDVLDNMAPSGSKGERLRMFLTDEGYSNALAAQKRGHIRIKQHAAVIEGHILPDKKKKRRH